MESLLLQPFQSVPKTKYFLVCGGRATGLKIEVSDKVESVFQEYVFPPEAIN